MMFAGNPYCQFVQQEAKCQRTDEIRRSCRAHHVPSARRCLTQHGELRETARAARVKTCALWRVSSPTRSWTRKSPCGYTYMSTYSPSDCFWHAFSVQGTCSKDVGGESAQQLGCRRFPILPLLPESLCTPRIRPPIYRSQPYLLSPKKR
jgi:hypothetical protein